MSATTGHNPPPLDPPHRDVAACGATQPPDARPGGRGHRHGMRAGTGGGPPRRRPAASSASEPRAAPSAARRAATTSGSSARTLTAPSAAVVVKIGAHGERGEAAIVEVAHRCYRVAKAGRRLHIGHDGPQDGPRSAPRRPKMAQDGPKMAQDRPRWAPRWPQNGPRGGLGADLGAS